MSILTRLTFAACLAVTLTACDGLETLQQIEETAASVRETADQVSARTDQIQRAAEDPVGALREAALGATFSKTETAEPGVFVLTDLTTGCQWLATYGPDGQATSMSPRTEPTPEGGTRQRCISVPGLSAGGAETQSN